MKLPIEFSQGDSFTWFESRSSCEGREFYSPAYSMKLYMKGAGDLVIAGVPTDDGWAFSLSPTDSAALPPGRYTFMLSVEKADGSYRRTLQTAQARVSPDIAQQSAGFDGRTQSELDLDQCQEAIRALINGGAVQEYTIGNRSVRKMTLGDLNALESKLKYQVYRERKAKMIKAGLGDGANVYVRFK